MDTRRGVFFRRLETFKAAKSRCAYDGIPYLERYKKTNHGGLPRFPQKIRNLITLCASDFLVLIQNLKLYLKLKLVPETVLKTC